MQTKNTDKMKQWIEPEAERGCADLGVVWSSEQIYGCLHFGLSPLQQRQEAYARRLRKAVIMHGKYDSETAEDVIRCIRQDLGDESVATCVRVGNSHGKTAIHIAGWRGNISEIDMLLQHGASLDAMTSRGHTPLVFAVMQQRDDCVEYLLRLGARTKIIDKRNESVVACAVKCGLQEATIAKLQAAEAQDARQWIDFTDMPKEGKRRAMAWLGTLIFMPFHCDPKRLDGDNEREDAEKEEESAAVAPEEVERSIVEDGPHYTLRLLIRFSTHVTPPPVLPDTYEDKL